ncbi:hypothetical protein [Chlamydia vaughanii]|uniref:hypothetical protein n=1 Tax=Chlamydia vaughanii TaxID=3112552 RepID=UPI0032B19144
MISITPAPKNPSIQTIPLLVSKLCKHALAIGSVFFIILAITLIILVVCGLVHPAVIILSVLLSVISGFMAVIALRNYIREAFAELPPPKDIPQFLTGENSL